MSLIRGVLLSTTAVAALLFAPSSVGTPFEAGDPSLSSYTFIAAGFYDTQDLGVAGGHSGTNQFFHHEPALFQEVRSEETGSGKIFIDLYVVSSARDYGRGNLSLTSMSGDLSTIDSAPSSSRSMSFVFSGFSTYVIAPDGSHYSFVGSGNFVASTHTATSTRADTSIHTRAEIEAVYYGRPSPYYTVAFEKFDAFEGSG